MKKIILICVIFPIAIGINLRNLCYSQNTLIKSGPGNILRTGLELLEKEKYGAAQKFFQDYINNLVGQGHPENSGLQGLIEAEYYIALCALNLSQPDTETLFDDFIAKYPGHSKAILANYELGNFWFRKKNYEKAIHYFAKVDIDLLSAQQQIETQFKLAYAYFGKKEFDKAMELFSKIKYGYHKYTYAANYYAGYIAYLNKEYDKAINDLHRAGQNEAYAPLIPLMIANIYYKQGKLEVLINYAEGIIPPVNTNKRGIKAIDKIILLLAEAYYKMGDKWEKAALYFSRYVEMNKNRFKSPVRDPQSAILYRLAYSEFKINNFDSSAVHFKQIAIPSTRDSLGQSAAYYLGVCYVKTGKKQFALAAFDKARKPDFDTTISEASAFQYAKLNYDLGILPEAITAFKYFVDNYPNSGVRVEADALLTEAYLNTNKYDEAISYIEGLKRKSQRIKAAYQRLLFYFGVESFNKEQYLKAVQLFEKSLQYPIEVQLAIAANFWLGETYSTGIKYDKAIPYYLRVFENTSSPKNEFYIKTMYGVGYAYFNTKQYKKALINFQRYVNHMELAEPSVGEGHGKVPPSGGFRGATYNSDAVLRLADCYFVTKIYNDAIKYYEKAIKESYIDADYAYFQKGVIYGITSNPDLAKQNLDMVIRRFSGSRYYDDALFQTAQIDFENGKNEDAITGFSRLIKVKPGSPFVPYALLKRGIAQENLQKYDKAIADYKKIIEDHATHKVAHDAITSLQQALTSAGKSENFDETLAKFKEANPNSEALESIEFETAKALYYNQKYKEAISSFTDYLNNYPVVGRIDNPTMYYYDSKYYLAESYYRLAVVIEQKDSSGYGAAYDNALRYYKEVMVDNKSYLNKSIYRIAGLEYKNHSYKSAIKYYDQLLEKASNKKQQFNAWTGLMLSYYGLSKFDKVEMYANEILSRGNASNRNIAMLYLGKAAYASGDHLKATDEFVNTLNTAKDANGAEAQYLLSELLYKDRNYKQSLETLFDLNQNFANYTKWVDKAFLLIADNYIAQDELFQAKATLNSIIEKSTSKETVEAAKVKLGNIGNKELGD
ncbi:MAG: tetratricopeptide repeat protein [Cytophagales bacterium]|nr:tetratricopeptide repeat protein [Cytophagales bacterium]